MMDCITLSAVRCRASSNDPHAVRCPRHDMPLDLAQVILDHHSSAVFRIDVFSIKVGGQGPHCPLWAIEWPIEMLQDESILGVAKQDTGSEGAHLP